MTLATNIPNADSRAYAYQNVFGILRFPLDKAHNVSSIYCPTLKGDAVIQHSMIDAAGRDSLREFEAVTVDIGQHRSQNGIRRVVTRFNPELIVPPMIVPDCPVTFAKAFFLQNHKNQFGFVAFRDAAQSLLEARYTSMTPGVRKYFMYNEELLAQSGDEARATIHLHANEHGHAVVLLQP